VKEVKRFDDLMTGVRPFFNKWREEVTQRHELVDECLAPIQCASAVVGFDLAGVNTKYLQYRLAMSALDIVRQELEQDSPSGEIDAASIKTVLLRMKACLENERPDHSVPNAA
jgi:hypothetical protein